MGCRRTLACIAADPVIVVDRRLPDWTRSPPGLLSDNPLFQFNGECAAPDSEIEFPIRSRPAAGLS